MADYMTLHASAYPPTSWTSLANRQSKPSQTSNNKLWAEMTSQYERSMAKRQHLMTSNFLSETATKNNIRRMRPDTQKRYRQRGAIAFNDAADVDYVWEILDEYAKKKDGLLSNPMETVLEVDESGHSTDIESLLTKKVVSGIENFGQHKDSTRTRRAEVGREDRGPTAHIEPDQRQLTSDVTQLREFLRGRLFDQYCLMQDTPMEKKNATWLRYGKCIILGYQNSKCANSATKDTAENPDLGDPEVGERLERMINESGLDPAWVMEHIKNYYGGNDHIGQWQRYMQGHRWRDLAENFTKDIEQLQKINSTRSSNSRRCNIMLNMLNSKRQFFKRLNGAQDYELSDKALRMEEGYENLSTSSPAS